VTLTARLGGTPLRVAVALDGAELDAAPEAFMSDLALYLALLAVTLILAGLAQVTEGLRLLGQVGARVAAVRSGAAKRLGDDFPAEVRPLTAEVDTLLEARDAKIVRAGARAADLAHGLRTPLQALIGEASRLRASDRGDAADGIEDIAIAMRRHVERELARTRIAARAPTAACDPSTVIAWAIAGVARTPDGTRVEWTRDLPSGLTARIDPDDLVEALGALIENAARHASGRVAVAVTPALTPTGGTAGAVSGAGPVSGGGGRVGDILVTVRDDGPGIPESTQERLMDRGARMDQSGVGSGLGLSIARKITAASGGGLELRNLRPGLKARLTLRTAPTTPTTPTPG
jgi:signal transduction histidine kinase